MKTLTRNALAKATGLSIDTLRYYEKLKLISPVHIKNNGYHYFCTSNILKLIRFNFTKEIGMNTSEGVELAKIQKLSVLETHLTTHEKLKNKELAKLNDQLKNIKHSLKVIKKIKSFDFEKILLIEGTHNIHISLDIIPEQSIDNVDFLIELSQKNHKKSLGFPTNIERCLSLNIDPLSKEITSSKVFISTFEPVTMTPKKNVETPSTNKFLTIYFKSNIGSLTKNLHEKFELLKKKLNQLPLNQFGKPDLIIASMHSPLYLESQYGSIQIYILRLPVR